MVAFRAGTKAQCPHSSGVCREEGIQNRPAKLPPSYFKAEAKTTTRLDEMNGRCTNFGILGIHYCSLNNSNTIGARADSPASMLQIMTLTFRLLPDLIA